ncbi:hypothetical protein [Fuchsiella alkaliacetigena]|uniref:hypothetical protein n=1 Tax=Fuchsiella alkaliacetigena TaxID=957042 RepID=UPI00200A18B2|nr:hypothetical protein [Fuchsiella alkaliacetigena]MCK8825311.1 hypothetical protein [Fuchsiella alkaliacetigena]
MLKNYLKVIILLLLILMLTACGGEELTGTSVSFEELAREVDEQEYDIAEEIKKLDGEVVEMEGYMSTLTPLDVDYFYLTANPGVACPFCEGEEVNYFTVVQVYFPSEQGFRFSRDLQRVVGRLEVGEKVDQYGAKSKFRIKAEIMETVE